LTCLVTSRQALRIAGEREYPLSPLPLPQGREQPAQLLEYPSVALYSDRAKSVKPDFALTDHNAVSVATLCRHLDGAPLAIEMAATWAKTLPPAKMLERFDLHLHDLVSRRRDLPAPHQSLRATVEWSHGLLSPDLQFSFRRLSIFRGGWTLEAAEAICGEFALEALAELQERSLLVAEERKGAVRYRMLETLRQSRELKINNDFDYYLDFVNRSCAPPLRKEDFRRCWEEGKR
jgi:non-specific serine/threonine protein kinase